MKTNSIIVNVVNRALEERRPLLYKGNKTIFLNVNVSFFVVTEFSSCRQKVWSTVTFTMRREAASTNTSTAGRNKSPKR